MKRESFLSFIILIVACTGLRQDLFSQRSDTLYMNARWQICEKPFASYYRFGRIIIDTFWYYQGYIADYYITDTMEMEGNYSALGEKEGFFYFYYPNGKQKASGEYISNHRFGVWEYYHPDGNLRLRIRYTGDDKNFTVLDYIDSTGKVMTKDSTGTFEFELQNGRDLYRLEGEVSNGQRAGTWKYYSDLSYKNKEQLLIKESYEKGEFKKGYLYNPMGGGILDTYKKNSVEFLLTDYKKLRTTEFFEKDRTTFRNRSDDQDLADYLIRRQAPSFSVESESFDESFTGLLKTLNISSVRRFFNDPQKIYNGEIVLNVSDSGDIEEVEITGNLTSKEKEYMEFFIKKFKNIHEIIVENVGIDAYHKIYFYSVLYADIFPKRFLSHLPEKEFFFAPMPYDKLVQLVKENMKKKRK